MGVVTVNSRLMGKRGLGDWWGGETRVCGLTELQHGGIQDVKQMGRVYPLGVLAGETSTPQKQHELLNASMGLKISVPLREIILHKAIYGHWHFSYGGFPTGVLRGPMVICLQTEVGVHGEAISYTPWHLNNPHPLYSHYIRED